ncbi:MAG: tRNA uridine-5-carboxymethylaminomethyl(34) synthesis GTPase MnmE [Bacteroidetes bacterium]|nr:tRNA uridine-5-carboxymethylaminomethyl(34) synthesis GTPase MnmE [Bacteroidota bacterium]
MPSSTIAALATPPGISALAVVRLSGPQARQIARACLRSERVLHVKHRSAIVDLAVSPSGEPIDQVVVLVFDAPHSSTGEDVVEITTHGGLITPQRLLEALYHNGAVPAEAGAFSQRAFLNGKIDLAQAEAIADVIHARSLEAQRASAKQLVGSYGSQLAALRDRLVEAAALLELELDFSEEDVDFIDRTDLVGRLQQVRAYLAKLIASFRSGRLIRDGIQVVLVGAPNAGKSTLMNALVGRDRAIVSDIAGTTRDTLDVSLVHQGLVIDLTDTAGLRNTDDIIEAEGVRRAMSAWTDADVGIYVTEYANPSTAQQSFEESILARRPPESCIILVNKQDDSPVGPLGHARMGAKWDDHTITFSASRALTDTQSVTNLLDLIVAKALPHWTASEESVTVTNQRHHGHLQSCAAAIDESLEAIAREQSGDMIAFSLRTAIYELGAITGKITQDDLLGEIFSRFCIGK